MGKDTETINIHCPYCGDELDIEMKIRESASNVGDIEHCDQKIIVRDRQVIEQVGGAVIELR